MRSFLCFIFLQLSRHPHQSIHLFLSPPFLRDRLMSVYRCVQCPSPPTPFGSILALCLAYLRTHETQSHLLAGVRRWVPVPQNGSNTTPWPEHILPVTVHTNLCYMSLCLNGKHRHCFFANTMFLCFRTFFCPFFSHSLLPCLCGMFCFFFFGTEQTQIPLAF